MSENNEEVLVKSQHYNEGDIQVLEGLEPVRKRPGMYIGSTDERGLHHLITEIVDNSIDEALAGYCSRIEVTLNKDGSCSVLDNGRGIPTGIHKTEGISAVEVVLTKLHAGGKFGGEGYKISGGLHGVGLSVVNALSTVLTVNIYQNGNHYFQEYRRGVPQDRLNIIGTAVKTGTLVTFTPDPEIFETVDFNYETLKNRFREIAFLNKGLIISIADNRSEEPKKEEFLFEGGIIQYVEYLNATKNKLFPTPIYIKNISSTNEVEVALQYTDSFTSQVHAYANNINTQEGGTHLVGFKNAIRKTINEYGKSNNLLKGEEKLSGDDVEEGLTAIISVKLTDPQFEGQTKTKLGNSEMRGIVEKAVSEGLGDFLEENPNHARELIMKCITAKKASEAARAARESTRNKSLVESGGISDKLDDCNEKNRKLCEIYIIEGDSAGGTVKSARNRAYQAVLPLRGKILNVEKARIHRVLESEVIRTMFQAFGCGMLDNYDEEKLRYERIICMTDADVDGAHIRMLLLTFFYRYMPKLIENGHVYIALPPLYQVKKGKDVKYLYSDAELNAHLNEIGGPKGTTIQRYKGLGEMDAEQLWETTIDPTRRTLQKVKIDDAVEADRLFSLLMGEDPELRRTFIEENQHLVENLDV